MKKEVEKNRVLVGGKSKSTYLQSILYIVNKNSVDSVSIEGLGSQAQKALETAEKAEDLVPQFELEKVENIERNGCGGLRATLKVVGGDSNGT